MPARRRVLTDRCLDSVVVLRECFERGIDLPAEQQERAGSGVPLTWNDETDPTTTTTTTRTP